MPSIYDKLNEIDDDMDRDDINDVIGECESDAQEVENVLQKLEIKLSEANEDFEDQTIHDLRALLEEAKDEIADIRQRIY